MGRNTLLLAVLALCGCAIERLAPTRPGADIAIGGDRLVSGVTWTTSTTNVEMVAIGQYNDDFTILIDINDEGLAVGWGYEQTADGAIEQAISWKDGVFTRLGTLGGAFSRARSSNNAGTIVGEAQNANNRIRPVVWENGVIRALPALATPPAFGAALAINERGDVVGRDNDASGVAHAVLWPVGGGIVDLGILPDAVGSWATGINRHGTVFGQSHVFDPGLLRRATIWEGTVPTVLTLPGDGQPIGANVGTGQMFNDAGNFLFEIGRPGFGRGVVHIDGEYVTLPLLPDAVAEITVPYGLNEAGDVVGAAQGSVNMEPVFWPRVGTTLNLGVPPGFSSGDAHGVNNRGLAVGAAHGPWTAGTVGTGAVLWRVPLSDATPPTITYSSHPAVFNVDQLIAITCTVTDDGSGVAWHTCVNIGGEAYTFGLGQHTFTATAVDNVGNSSSASTGFTVAVTFGSLASLTRRFVDDDEIENNLVNHLAMAQEARAEGQDKLAEAQLRAFSNIVLAQIGRSISPENGAWLLQFADVL